MIPLGVLAYQHGGLEPAQPNDTKDPLQWRTLSLKLSTRGKAKGARADRNRDLNFFHRISPANVTLESRRPSAPPALPAVTFGTPFDVTSIHRPSPFASSVSPGPSPSRAKHVPIVIPSYVPLAAPESPIVSAVSSPIHNFKSSSNFDSHDRESGTGSPSLSLAATSRKGSVDSGKLKPRHVEILIPAWAQPVQRLSDSSFSAPSGRSSTVSPPSALSQDMARQTPNTSRSNTLDSSTSGSSAAQLYSGESKNGATSTAYLASVNSSQSSLYRPAPETNNEPQPVSATARTPGSATAISSAGPSPAVLQTAGLNTSPTSNSGRSGLVCNVYRTTGREPRPLVGATTTILGDKLYVFGGRRLTRTRPQLTSDLYELDLVRRHWTKLEAKGDIPPPRYFHSVCPLGDTKLVCYGGMSPAVLPNGQQTLPNQPTNPQDPQPEVVVMSDIHIYDIPSNTWMNIQSPDSPQGRYAHCASILPSSAVFASVNAPLSAIHHNQQSSANPNQGQLGVQLDGSGGAEMIVVGGQDSANHYIEQISVFNLRSLRWTATSTLGRSCGAYRSIVAALSPKDAANLGKRSSRQPDGVADGLSPTTNPSAGWSMLIYSNYNFLDVKLELQIRDSDGSLSEKQMQGTFTPPGLRFPNGGVINGHFVVCGTFLTSSKQEYALWALDLKSLTWSRIDTGPSNFSNGSWNRGVLWARRNTFVILGNRKRSLVEDYNHRRINFSNIAIVELESFGLYDNPRKVSPSSSFQSGSSPLRNLPLPISFNARLTSMTPAGRQLSKAAEELGNSALALSELADMDFLSMGGERTPVNSHVVARRWGPYFNQLFREGITFASDGAETATLRPSAPGSSGGPYPSRSSSITITPSMRTGGSGSSGKTTLVGSSGGVTLVDRSNSIASGATGGSNGTVAPSLARSESASTATPGRRIDTTLLEPPDTRTPANPSNRPRTLFLPHTHLTLQALVHYLYTSALPPPNSQLCTPQILCSLLQLARPYRVDGLLEAIIERLHAVLDGRNTAAIFNAAAMAAGGGDGISFFGPSGRLSGALGLSFDGDGERDRPRTPMPSLNESGESSGSSAAAGATGTAVASSTARPGSRGLPLSRINTDVASRNAENSHLQNGSHSATSTSASGTDDELSSAASETAPSEVSGALGGSGSGEGARGGVWSGELSAVIGLQKRGLRGLMEGRRLRELSGRAMSAGGAGGGGGGSAGGGGSVDAGRVGLGIA